MSGAVGSSPFVSRPEWGARAPRRPNSTSITPQGNTAHYEGPPMGEYPHESCPSKVRGIQAYHMDHNGWNDIAYSSISCIHGYVYEGRWLNTRTAANGTNDGNQRSYAHCVMMGAGDTLTDAAKRALRDVFAYFEARGSGGHDWVHKDWFPTACPGEPITTFVRDGLLIGGQPFPPPPPPPPPADDLRSKIMAKPVLRLNSKGEDVQLLQTLLMHHAHDLTGDVYSKFVDGVFGQHTFDILKTWQGRTHTLQSDGVCGSATWAWLCGV